MASAQCSVLKDSATRVYNLRDNVVPRSIIWILANLGAIHVVANAHVQTVAKAT